jgi:hypothetical protein
MNALSLRLLMSFNPARRISLFFALCFESMPAAASKSNLNQIAFTSDPEGLAPFVRIFFGFV